MSGATVGSFGVTREFAEWMHGKFVLPADGEHTARESAVGNGAIEQARTPAARRADIAAAAGCELHGICGERACRRRVLRFRELLPGFGPAIATWPNIARAAARCDTSFVENSASQVFALGKRSIR